MATPSSGKEPTPKAGDESGSMTHNFIRTIIDADLAAGKNDGRVATRFPPEPNGYLHIGHAKSICLNFGLALDYNGTCNLRFDDTNPEKEDVEYVDAIMEDVGWLGFKWSGKALFASDYFQQLYAFAEALVQAGKAYVCSLSADQIRESRGTLTEPGTDSPYRNRSVEENLQLFRDMRDGRFEDGAHVLRAKIDMAHPNLLMRDPTLYRIRHAHHHRTGDQWCIYPMYDFTHCLSDAIEHITHSICTLEFENNRALYDWVLDNTPAPCHPQQIEFARLNLSYTIVSKRKLKILVDEGIVDGWDDPRMPTLSGLRRRGFPPAAIRDFCERIGVAKANSVVDVALLEFSVRERLNATAPRMMAVLRPLRVVIENYPEDQTEEFDFPYHPENPEMGSRKVPFSRVIYVEKEDFREEAPRKWFRLAPGKEVRLRYAYYIRCEKVIRDENSGEVIELRCSYDPESRGGSSPDGRKVRGTLHWVSAAHATRAQVRLYDRLFNIPSPEDKSAGGDFKAHVNPASLEVLDDCQLEPSLTDSAPGFSCQFERLGYFTVDSRISSADALVFNRTVPLRDSWAKLEKKLKQKK